ncbi:unnamed protein product [Rotaria sp. Silwood1]|nr:unnamed protein product [Rotaria sp. Silwood1]CAF1062227.1 unnamed protein product [Rotaria sp. Silwood1]CAF3417961.1 unnamed protein product [Rotaria sp. Silwood1]CAF3427190.1 unnamed protein product [Rotaria sp. Silwood1]CAF4617660.1 unnamed protein product [Rotaria sp. Silwood1]
MPTNTVFSNDGTQPKLSISFIKSQKGKTLLVANEYTFKLNKTTTTTKYWKCTYNGGSSKIHTDLNDKLLKTIAIQRRVDNLGERYYDGVINAMEYLDGLSFIVAKRKN